MRKACSTIQRDWALGPVLDDWGYIVICLPSSDPPVQHAHAAGVRL